MSDSAIRLFPASARGLLLVVLILPFVAQESAAFGLRWSLSGGIGEPTEVREYIRPSPRITGTLTTHFTETTYLGVLADYARLEGEIIETAGSYWRVLALVHWTMGEEVFPKWCHPFGQLGIGAGRLEYVGLTQVELLVAPAARVAVGVSFHLHPRIEVATVLSLDRLEAAPNQFLREYPTLLSLNVEIVFHWPNGRPLLRPPCGAGAEGK